MKTLLAVLTVCLSCLGASWAHAVTVSPGNPLTVAFPSLPLVGMSNTYCCQSGASVFLAGDLLESGDYLVLDFFEDSLAEDSIGWVFQGGASPEASFGAGVAVHASSTPWSDDFQGFIRVTALSGSVNVDHIIISVFPDKDTPGRHYAQTFNFSAISTPLPATLLLFSSALGGLGFVGWRRQQVRAIS